jgi:hypothetical protein
MIGRRWDQDANVQIVNFYSEIVAHDGATRRFLSEETVLPADGPAGDRIDLLSCRPAA